jgi:hypothetical protein
MSKLRHAGAKIRGEPRHLIRRFCPSERLLQDFPQSVIVAASLLFFLSHGKQSGGVRLFLAKILEPFAKHIG